MNNNELICLLQSAAWRLENLGKIFGEIDNTMSKNYGNAWYIDNINGKIIHTWRETQKLEHTVNELVDFYSKME